MFYFPNVRLGKLPIFSYLKNFWLQNYFDMCFDNLIKYITSLLCSACSMILIHLYIYNNVFNDTSIHLSKEEEKNPKHFKTHIFVKLLDHDK